MIEAMITEHSVLDQICQQAQQHAFVCIDTEFVRTKTFYAQLGLVQLGFAEKNYLIDVLEISDLTPLKQLLCNSLCLKVLHAASEDIEIFYQLFQQVPFPIFDTQIAAKLLGIADSIGYANLCQQILAVEVKKDQTQSNWVARPLSADQMRYAALDVHYLQPIFVNLQKQLIEVDRWSWVIEDSLRSSQHLTVSDLNTYYLGIKRAWRLQQSSLLCLQQLCVWREKTARQQNVPRNRIADNKSLTFIASKMPLTLVDLAKVSSWHTKQMRLFGQQVIAIVKSCSEQTDCSLKAIDSPLSKDQQKLCQQIKDVIQFQSKQLTLSVESVVNKKQIEHLVRLRQMGNLDIPEYWQGWREQFLPHIEPILKQ